MSLRTPSFKIRQGSQIPTQTVEYTAHEDTVLTEAAKMTDATYTLAKAKDKLSQGQMERSGLMSLNYEGIFRDEVTSSDITSPLFEQTRSRIDDIGLTGHFEDLLQPAYSRVKPSEKGMALHSFNFADQVDGVNPFVDAEGYNSVEMYRKALRNVDSEHHKYAKKIYALGEDDVIQRLYSDGFNDNQIAQIMNKNAKDIKIIPNLKKQKEEVNSKQVQDLIDKTAGSNVITKLLDDIGGFREEQKSLKSYKDVSDSFWATGMHGNVSDSSKIFTNLSLDEKTKIMKEYNTVKDWAKENHKWKFGESEQGLRFVQTFEDKMPTPSEYMLAYDNPELTKEVFKNLDIDIDANPILSDENYMGLQLKDSSGVKDILDASTKVPDTVRDTSGILNDGKAVLDDLSSKTQTFLNETDLGQKVSEAYAATSDVMEKVGENISTASDTAEAVAEPISAVTGAYDVVKKDASAWDRFTGAVDVAGAAGADSNPIYAAAHIGIKAIDMLDDLFV